MFPRRWFSLRYWAERFFPQSRGEPANVGVATPAGAFRRTALLARVFGRRATFARVWTWRANMKRISADTLTKTVRESLYLVFDFSKCPEVLAGGTLSSPTVYSDAGITVGTPEVTVAIWEDIPAGDAIVALFSGGTEDAVYDVSCTATVTDGSKVVTREVPGRLVIAGVGC